MKGGDGMKKANFEALNIVVGGGGVDLGGGDGGGVKVQNFEGIKGTRLRKSEEEEKSHVKSNEGEEEDEFFFLVFFYLPLSVMGIFFF